MIIIEERERWQSWTVWLLLISTHLTSWWKHCWYIRWDFGGRGRASHPGRCFPPSCQFSCCPNGFLPFPAHARRPCRDASWRVKHQQTVSTNVSLQLNLFQSVKASCWCLEGQDTRYRPVDVDVDRDVVAVVIVVRLVCLNLTVASSHHHVALVQKHLTHAVLYTHTQKTNTFKNVLSRKDSSSSVCRNKRQIWEACPTWSWW